jgi:hypothetical protein
MREAQSLLDELRKIQELKENIKRLDVEIEAMESAVQRVTQGMRVGSRGTVTHDAVGDAVARAHDAIDEAMGVRGEYLLRVLDAEKLMDALALKPQHRAILRSIYIDGMVRTKAKIPNWPRVSDTIGYSVVYCKELWHDAKEIVRYVQMYR